MRAGLLVAASLAAIALLPSAATRSAQAQPAAPSTLVCTTGPDFDLRATDGYITTPDGNSVYMWSYAPAAGAFQLPGPTLCVEAGEHVTVTLQNDLEEPVSIVFPGQAGVTSIGGSAGLLAQEAAPGATVTYEFDAAEPGTYLYESGSEPDKQVQMGLYGALIVRPAGHPDWAYNDSSTQFDTSREYLLLIHDIDPALHFDVEHGRPFDIAHVRDRYWTINGRSFPDTIAPNDAAWLPGQPYGSLVTVEARDPSDPGLPALIRYANAGMVNHPFHPHGNHLRTIARDGRLLRGPGGEDASSESFTRTIGSGQTADLLFQWLNVDPWTSTGNPVPVQIPGLQNLVFKDDVTFFSGSPYLGEQDELPVGTTSFNQCGEFYFPWHSHALNEFQNFNEGFGGLATLLRVDPPGGCP